MGIRSKLAVILHADVVGSTALVQKDERVAHERIQAVFQRFSRTIESYGGTAHELRGDALVAEFDRASDAIAASLAFQEENQKLNSSIVDDVQPFLRIGIAMGEVVIADNTVTGDGVVLAQRLEQLAESGGVCIQDAAYQTAPKRLPFEYEFLGEQELKGFDEPVRVYFVSLREGASIPASDPAIAPKPIKAPQLSKWTRRLVGVSMLLVVVISFTVWIKAEKRDVTPADSAKMAYKLPDKPSVAVLPFASISKDKGQEFFADGITEDIITDLSKISGLFVAARNATLGYERSGVKTRQVAEDLGVQYVLEGSVRRSENSIRISAQLIDAIRGNQVWAERYDREIGDVFAVQSEVAAQVVKAMAVTLKSGEHERLFQKYTTNIEAYETFIRARRAVDVPSRTSIERGEALFKRVIELDPKFAGGYAGLSFNFSVKARFGFGKSRATDVQRSLELARKAILVDPQFGWSYVALGGAQLASGDATTAVATMREALILLPGDYEVHLFTGLYQQFAGQSVHALEHLELAKRMNPVDTDRNTAFLGMAYFMNKDYAKAEEYWTRRNEKFPAGSPLPYIFLAASFALQDKTPEANSVVEKLRQAFPEFRLEKWKWSDSYSLEENRERLHRGANIAGVP
ncbi:adenylate/guanylate cyclase domain-containing protein [Pseudomonadota bacterium]